MYKDIMDFDGMSLEDIYDLAYEISSECEPPSGCVTEPFFTFEELDYVGIYIYLVGANPYCIDNISLLQSDGETENSVPTQPVIVDIGEVESNNSTVDDLTPRGNGTSATDEDEETLYYAWYTIEHGGDFETPDFNTTFSETVDVASLGELTNATEYDTILVVTDLTDTNQSYVFNFTAQVLEEEPETSCGDEECNGEETCETCEADCGACEVEPSCGDEECNGEETCETCEADCGECEVEPSCGDEECNGTETCETCEADCGVCVEDDDDDDDDDGGTGGSGSSGTSTGYTVTPKDIPGEVEIEEDFDITYEIKTDSNRPIQVSTTVVILDENNREVFSESKSERITEEGTVNISVEGLSEGEYTLKIISKGKTLYTKTITSKDLATIEKESENKELLYIAIIGLLGLLLFIVYILRNKVKKIIRGKKKNGKQKTKNKSM